MLAKPSNSYEVIDLTNIDNADFSSPLQYPVTHILNIGQCTYPWATCTWNDPLVLKEMGEDCPTMEFPAPIPNSEFPPPVKQAPAEWEEELAAWEERLLDWKHFRSAYKQIENGQIKEWLREQQEAKERERAERAAREKAEKEKERERQMVTHAVSSATM
ncbi:hypothetical protein Moror_15777 [Moniliophthora roreri MCA 2997]|uniref:Uncharacterized protein n=1 Tax=Moniliophthora roreri (strain MCA 2997) TaxID=1381753 RepID=V2WK23_MONRO|nr:hypothetical protein Moror_15777 [Moniliophthora roreri MCA 2997]